MIGGLLYLGTIFIRRVMRTTKSYSRLKHINLEIIMSACFLSVYFFNNMALVVLCSNTLSETQSIYPLSFFLFFFVKNTKLILLNVDCGICCDWGLFYTAQSSHSNSFAPRNKALTQNLIYSAGLMLNVLNQLDVTLPNHSSKRQLTLLGISGDAFLCVSSTFSITLAENHTLCLPLFVRVYACGESK